MAFVKKDFLKAFELLLNTLEAEKIETFFGKGTKIKIRDVVFSPVKKTCLVDCVVVFGEKIPKIEKDDEKFVRYMVWSTAELMISEFSVSVMVGYDV